jgi:hypothetical protein
MSSLSPPFSNQGQCLGMSAATDIGQLVEEQAFADVNAGEHTDAVSLAMT